MKTSNRRDFLKKAALAGASALVAPGLLATEEKEVISFSSSPVVKLINLLFLRIMD